MTFNFAFYLSLVLAAMGCTGLLLAGKGKWYGWGIGLAVQPIWATYAIVTHGYGLLLTCLMYGFVNAKNLLKWHNRSPAVKRLEKVDTSWKGLEPKIEIWDELENWKKTSPLHIDTDDDFPAVRRSVNPPRPPKRMPKGNGGQPKAD